MRIFSFMAGVALVACAGSVFAANRPSGFVTICTENKTCSVAPNTTVAFGRADQFRYQVLSGSFVCSEAVFGPRIPGGVNECSIPRAGNSSAQSSSVASSVASSLSSSSRSSSSSSVRSSSSLASSASSVPVSQYFPGCEKPEPSETVQLSATRVVAAGEIFDGLNKRYNLSGGSQSEGQPPVFRVENGGVVRNVIIGNLAADGIHCLGNCTLERVWWEDIGEDAATAMGPVGTIMNVTCGAAFNGSDKTFQFNGRGELHISKFYVEKSGKLARTCGDCTNNGGPRKLVINEVITRDVSTIVGINSNFGDVAVIRNLTLNNSSNAKTKICQVYKGVVKGQGSTSALGVEFDTANCHVSQSDVTLLGISRMNTEACTGSCPIP
ncbi:pectate lyase [Cellvibrio japonicus]|uniref:Pectate lyase n=1 Tax=Cellvibrio japonicus (strain Ueda107) TaxID=498211 RepID=B3PGF7_CELJU|nr:pectate lyase [Cellvibrio japonicus]ACE85330.1 pectate lyase, putative, pel3A [Cellvibrio japonicus Ueda107]QEI10949.1 pectate lyase [Cellvibrio japonicus]QEI14525.1 pectate lyase [Cellvibrio japonicus]QEI18103.1 pectate lyase [Cellvibrio japonicus]